MYYKHCKGRIKNDLRTVRCTDSWQGMPRVQVKCTSDKRLSVSWSYCYVIVLLVSFHSDHKALGARALQYSLMF